MVRETDYEPNARILNSLLLLYCNALLPVQVETDVLPLYDRYRIKHDVYTYQNLAKLYSSMREFSKVFDLYNKCKEEQIIVNKMLLVTTLDAAMREEQTNLIYKLLKDFVEIKQQPHARQLKILAGLKHLPDHLYMILRTEFNVEGTVGLKNR